MLLKERVHRDHRERIGETMLKRIIIKGLFGQFDEYDISLKDEGITILTGPNGYGKTTILKIINAIADQNFRYLFFLPFREITLITNDDTLTFRLEKTDDKKFNIYENDIEVLSLDDVAAGAALIEFNKVSGFDKVSKSLEDDIKEQMKRPGMTQGKVIFSLQNIINEAFKKIIIHFYKYKDPEKIFPELSEVYFIREQRLIREMFLPPEESLEMYHIQNDIAEDFTRTIEEYALDLKKNITSVIEESDEKSRELNSTFPGRLMKQKERIIKEKFVEQYEKLKNIQSKLHTYGLPDILGKDLPEFKEEDAKALTVYLNDTEQKMSIFDELVQKLDIFTDILNNRRLAFKKIRISKDNGFEFIAKNGEILSLSGLSSGEQHEVVMLYNLLFKVKPGTLVLIDEPEISLHVAWLKEFLNDILKIVELQKIHVMIATHSPQVINDRWDLTIDLWELNNAHPS